MRQKRVPRENLAAGHTKSIPKPAYTRPNIRDKPKHHASDTPCSRHVPGSRSHKDPRRVLPKRPGEGLHV